MHQAHPPINRTNTRLQPISAHVLKESASSGLQGESIHGHNGFVIIGVVRLGAIRWGWSFPDWLDLSACEVGSLFPAQRERTTNPSSDFSTDSIGSSFRNFTSASG